MENAAIIIKYIDLFGTRCSFYSEKMPKLYTLTGGMFSIISILVCILIFLIFSLDDIKRKNPITTTSSIPSEGYKKIKFGEEKIWIPWRIVDYNNNEFVNHTGILYPIIYYYSGIKENNSKDFNLTKKILNYKLCNETSMAYESNVHFISVPLNELYCIDMEDLDMGGSWITEFINYVQFDLYYCEDGINYNQTNQKCTSYNEIINFTGEKNSLKIALYYPLVQFQPTNKKNPVIIIYKQHFFHLSRYTSKIERIFLQENVLTDDLGWIVKKELNHSYWGLHLISGDNYFTGNGKDLMNEGSNSRAYSFNLYLEPGIIHYKRYYKKLHTILGEALPLAYIVFFIFKYISKFFKFAEGNKKLFELLFENLKEKTNPFEENLNKLRRKNSINNMRKLSFSNVLYKEDIDLKNKNKPKVSVDYINYRKNEYSPSFLVNKKRNTNITINNITNNLKSKKFHIQNKKNNNPNNSNLNLLMNDLIKKKDNNNNKISEEKVKNKTPPKNFHFSDKNVFIIKKKMIKNKLFPYKYYLLSVFLKNLNITKKNYFFPARFAKIYSFLCQLFDVTTYIILQREFSALKNTLSEKNIKLIEKYDKINVNSKDFLKDISYCIGEQKLNILVQGIKKKI